MFKDLNEYVENLIDKNNILREQLNDWNKDDEIQKLNDQYESVLTHSVHIMNDKEFSELKAFRQDHYKACKSGTKEIITHNAIGSCITVVCHKCGDEKNITDVNNW
jgi:hypothetical protein